jgi:ParB family protein of integrating conjugative element (PFGI_1 class)
MASRSKFTEVALSEFLGDESNSADDVHSWGSITRKTVTVTIDQLRPYDNNPRQSRNPNFDAILASIENRGLDYPPNISRRHPDDPYYTIIDGGNTRLEILNYLHQKYMRLVEEADDDAKRQEHQRKVEQFYRIDCVYRPWVSESDTLAGHMSENEERSPLLFIERALAVQRFRRFYEAEDQAAAKAQGLAYTDKPLSGRSLAERITKQGWTVSHQHINRFEYATNNLIDVVPNALWAGAGEPLIRNLRRHEKAYLDFWHAAAAGRDMPDEDVLKLFYETLAKYDGDSVDVEGFVGEMNSSISQELSLSYLTVCAEIDAWLAGRTPPIIDGDITDTSGGDEKRSSTTRKVNAANEDVGTSQRNGAHDTVSTERGNSDRQAVPDANSGAALNNSTTMTLDSPTQSSSTYPDTTTETERIILSTTRSIAEPLGFKVYGVESGPKRDAVGCGCFLIAPDEQPFNPHKDDTRAAVWWALFRFSRAYKNAAKVSSENVFRKSFSKYLTERSTLDTLLVLDEALSMLPEEMYRKFEELQRLIRHNNNIQGGGS